MIDQRRAELAAALRAVRGRIERACAHAGRGRDEVTLIVVTKTFPVQDVAHLRALGVVDVGENRDQEARSKAAAGVPGLRWHFIGQLQTNKARSVARYADVVHSVDRAQLVAALDRGAVAAGRRLEVLLQVDLTGSADGWASARTDGDPADEGTGAPSADRGGARPAEIPALADQVASASALRCRGVMAVAPLREDPVRAFARLREVSDVLRAQVPGADWMSAGMSGDLEQAVAAGATHLRVGSAILGQRPVLQ